MIFKEKTYTCAASSFAGGYGEGVCIGQAAAAVGESRESARTRLLIASSYSAIATSVLHSI